MALTSRNNTPKKGECECCATADVDLILAFNMMMCASCAQLQARAVEAVKFVEDARKQDDTIQIKTDVFNAASASFTELAGAIQNNPTIPDGEKQFALVNEAAVRIQKLNAAIFESESKTIALKNERHSWLTNTQNAAAKLSAEYRAKYAQYDLTYTSPGLTHKEKSTKAVTPSNKVKFSKTELYDVAKKYKMNATAINMTATAHNLTPEGAAKFLLELQAKKA